MTPDFVDNMSMFKEVEKQEDKRNLQKIFKALSTLTKKQQRRFLLHYYHGLSISEIAVLENVHCTSIYHSIQNARLKIMNKIKNK